MDAFFEHHHDSIRFRYRCFDRILLNGLIQPFQQPERVVGFFTTYRKQYPVSRNILRGMAEQFHNWVKHRALKWCAPIVEAPAGRRDEFVAPYFRRAKPDQVVVILKAREPARIIIAIGKPQDDRWHLQLTQRWVVQYNFYVNDRRWGRMFVRMCPYFPFSARVCLNQHHWLANRLRQERIPFQQCSNAFLSCAQPARLQQLADSLTSRDLLMCAQKWLAAFTPFFSEKERREAGCQHRLFFAQVEYCDNLVFRRRAALDRLGERLLDANRTIGQPDKITTIFGRKLTKLYRGKLQTVIEDIKLPTRSFAATTVMGSLSSTCAIISSCVPSQRPTMSPITASRKLSSTCRTCVNGSPPSPTDISTSSRTSWRLLSTAANCANSLSPPSCPTANASPV
jgi:hypothetical protein